ncbi:hypothetical protein BBK36DRAFT_1143982 [Trichoderma citrinoviride]|uniref:BTB domain-containing protein n=1 Tax=Trichoderma citrinoviride TaxID=58853 RepID=A0A2T4B2S7_9HYPO|nr:hypothetical protein BBK36DRAFT_1143982 [Trichoderma citrinoviride]PTB63511.1 hypothetical protein BBK36DRAFT_1143982 [Trichoderma citrinoviride]
MAPKLHEIDPNGDTLLILRNPNAPFAVPAPPPGPPQKRAKTHQSADSKPEVHMRLSSKHLALASEYFQKLMVGGWKETTTTAEGQYSYTIQTEDFDEEALLIVMNIIHGKTTNLPRSVNLKRLAKISLLVDYYRCHEAVQFFSQTWLKSLGKTASKSRDHLLELSVSWVSANADAFRNSSMSLIKSSVKPIDSLGLPIPQNIIDVLNARREAHISAILAGFERLVKEQYPKKYIACSFACSSMALGALIKQLVKTGLHHPSPLPPYAGHSILTLNDAICDLGKLPFDKFCPRGAVGEMICDASIKPYHILDKEIKKIKGLEISDFMIIDQPK